MKRITTALLIAMAAVLLSGCAVAAAFDVPEEEKEVEFAYVHDWAEPKVPEGAVRIAKERDELEAAKAEQAQQEAQAAQEQAEYYGYDESLNNNPAYLNYGQGWDNGDGFRSQGVRDFNGTTETWYSSNVAYHYRTGEWHTDDEGYYRDADGYYVVASEDHAQGEVFETSKGEARVYDSGCANGVTDFYTNF